MNHYLQRETWIFLFICWAMNDLLHWGVSRGLTKVVSIAWGMEIFPLGKQISELLTQWANMAERFHGMFDCWLNFEQVRSSFRQAQLKCRLPNGWPKNLIFVKPWRPCVSTQCTFKVVNWCSKTDSRVLSPFLSCMISIRALFPILPTTSGRWYGNKNLWQW